MLAIAVGEVGRIPAGQIGSRADKPHFSSRALSRPPVDSSGCLLRASRQHMPLACYGQYFRNGARQTYVLFGICRLTILNRLAAKGHHAQPRRTFRRGVAKASEPEQSDRAAWWLTHVGGVGIPNLANGIPGRVQCHELSNRGPILEGRRSPAEARIPHRKRPPIRRPIGNMPATANLRWLRYENFKRVLDPQSKNITTLG